MKSPGADSLTVSGRRPIICSNFPTFAWRPETGMIVTIDGPVASGKSTAAKNLAEALGFEHLDTGAIYRAITLLALSAGTDPADRAAVRRLLGEVKVHFEEERIHLNGRDVSDDIRRPDITSSVKPFAENPEVREFVKKLEHGIASGKDIVVEGRDMGTVVFPEANVKVFLSASAQERARRRWEELQGKGIDQDYETVLRELDARDHADANRSIAPLRKAPDAIEFDSTGLSQEETAGRLLEIVRSRLKGQ